MSTRPATNAPVPTTANPPAPRTSANPPVVTLPPTQPTLPETSAPNPVATSQNPAVPSANPGPNTFASANLPGQPTIVIPPAEGDASSTVDQIIAQTTKSSSSSSSNNTLPIIGGVVGGVVLLILIIVCFCFYRKRMKEDAELNLDSLVGMRTTPSSNHQDRTNSTVPIRESALSSSSYNSSQPLQQSANIPPALNNNYDQYYQQQFGNGYSQNYSYNNAQFGPGVGVAAASAAIPFSQQNHGYIPNPHQQVDYTAQWQEYFAQNPGAYQQYLEAMSKGAGEEWAQYISQGSVSEPRANEKPLPATNPSTQAGPAQGQEPQGPETVNSESIQRNVDPKSFFSSLDRKKAAAAASDQ